VAILTIENHGQLVTASSYWGSEQERAGKLHVSCNAGAIRVLLPGSMRPLVNELRPAEYAILSRGPWPGVCAEGVEILWEDHADRPHAWHLAPESFDLLPAEPNAGREWTITLWDARKGRPHLCLQRPCHWRRVAKIPCLESWRPG
jgi:hypothetical protein